MADDWEEDDWDATATNFKAQAPAVTKEFETKGQAILAGAAEPDMSKFADEDEEEEDEKVHAVPASQPKKKEEKKYTKASGEQEKPLDDPQAEKLRQQRLVEQSDYAAAKELFGGVGSGVNLEVFLPKSVKDFEDYAATIASKYVVGHGENKNYKAFLKSLIKHMCAPLPSTECKDLETCIAGVRSDKHKAEQAAVAAKTKCKKQLNVGKANLSAGLEDYQYDDAGDNDGYDFM